MTETFNPAMRALAIAKYKKLYRATYTGVSHLTDLQIFECWQKASAECNSGADIDGRTVSLMRIPEFSDTLRAR